MLNKNIFRPTIWTLILVGLASCKGFFDFNRDLTIPETPPQLVLIADMGVGEQYPAVFLTRTRTPNGLIRWDFNDGDTIYKDPNNPNATIINRFPNLIAFDTVRNAKIELYEDNILVGTFKPIVNDIKGVYETQLARPIAEGKTYRIVASAPGFETVESIQRAPRTVLPTRLRFEKEGLIRNNYRYDGVYITFTDPVGGSDAYLASGFWTDTIGETTPLIFSKYENFAIDETLLPDKNFDGKAFEWRIAVNFLGNLGNSRGRVRSVSVRFKTVGADLEKYKRSLIQIQNADGNPFVEPFQAFTNIKNGAGIFNLSGRDTIMTVPYR